MELCSSVNNASQMLCSVVDEDQEMEIEIESGDGTLSEDFYLNKTGASILINHLKKEFGL